MHANQLALIVFSMTFFKDFDRLIKHKFGPQCSSDEERVDKPEDEEPRQRAQRPPDLATLGGLIHHGYKDRGDVDEICQQEERVDKDCQKRDKQEESSRGDDCVPEADEDHRSEKFGPHAFGREKVLPVDLDALNEARRPALELAGHEVVIMRLNGIADRFFSETHIEAFEIDRPGQVHVFANGALVPATHFFEDAGAIRGEAARGDERAAVVVLNRLEESKGVQIFEVSAAFPERANVARDDHATDAGDGGRAHLIDVRGVVKLAHKSFDGVVGERSVGVDCKRVFGLDQVHGVVERAGFAALVLQGTNDFNAKRASYVAGVVGGAVVDHDYAFDGRGLILHGLDGVRYEFAFVICGDEHGEWLGRLQATVGAKHDLGAQQPSDRRRVGNTIGNRGNRDGQEALALAKASCRSSRMCMRGRNFGVIEPQYLS